MITIYCNIRRIWLRWLRSCHADYRKFVCTVCTRTSNGAWASCKCSCQWDDWRRNIPKWTGTSSYMTSFVVCRGPSSLDYSFTTGLHKERLWSRRHVGYCVDETWKSRQLVIQLRCRHSNHVQLRITAIWITANHRCCYKDVREVFVEKYTGEG